MLLKKSYNGVCTETKKIHEMWNKYNLMKKNPTELKKLLLFSMSAKFSFTSLLNKGRVQRIFVTGRILYQVEQEMKLLILKNFVFYLVHTSSFLEKHFECWCAMLWNLEVNILGVE